MDRHPLYHSDACCPMKSRTRMDLGDWFSMQQRVPIVPRRRVQIWAYCCCLRQAALDMVCLNFCRTFPYYQSHQPGSKPT